MRRYFIPMSMFDDENKMIIPLSIDDIDANKSSYFFSTKKLVIAFVTLVPYFVLIIFIYSMLPSIPVAITFTALYLILYSWIIRTFVFEESVQKESLHELQDNKKSGFEHFWEIDKVGDNEGNDDGLLYLRQDGVTLKRGLIIKFDSGSTVGVPEDFLRTYRETQQAFLRGLYQNKLSFRWYKVRKLPELNPALIKRSADIQKCDNDALRKLLKLQLNAYLRVSMDTNQRYVDYIVVTNKDFSTLSNFKNVLEDTVNNTLRTNPAFKDVAILDKSGVDDFFATYYMQDDVDTNSISKTNRTKPFSAYAKVIKIVDSDNQNVDIELLDNLNSQIESDSTGYALDDVFSLEERKKAKLEERRKKEREQEISKVRKLRIEDKLTHEDYLKELERVDYEYKPENYNPNRAEEEKEAERERKKQVRQAARESKRQSKEEVETKKWFEDEEYDMDEGSDVLDTDNDSEMGNEHSVDLNTLLGSGIDSEFMSDTEDVFENNGPMEYENPIIDDSNEQTDDTNPFESDDDEDNKLDDIFE